MVALPRWRMLILPHKIMCNQRTQLIGSVWTSASIRDQCMDHLHQLYFSNCHIHLTQCDMHWTHKIAVISVLKPLCSSLTSSNLCTAQYFTSQREDFEGTREGILVWLTEMDLQLTNVEHFSESDIEDKMRQLNVSLLLLTGTHTLIQLYLNMVRQTFKPILNQELLYPEPSQ